MLSEYQVFEKKKSPLIRCCAHIHKRQKWHHHLVTVLSLVQSKTCSSSGSSSWNECTWPRTWRFTAPLRSQWIAAEPPLFVPWWNVHGSSPHCDGDPHPVLHLTHVHEKSSTSIRRLQKGGGGHDLSGLFPKPRRMNMCKRFSNYHWLHFPRETG